MAAKSDTVVKLVIVLFISLLSFSVGLFAGKNFSDNQHTISQLEPSKTATREVASEHGATATESKSGAMTDEEIAKLAEEFVADEKPVAAGHGETAAGHGEAAPAAGHGETAPAHGAPAKTETAKHGEAPAAHGAPVAAADHGAKAEPSSVAKDLAAGKAPQTRTAPAAKSATAESRIPSSLPQNVAQYTVGKFTVQVASYADEAEAQKFASDLKTKGYSAFYVPANIKGKTWFRVSVGQFATSKEAASYRTELISKAKVSSAIVQKITE
ncbi:SPOR domain-containing protein [Bdellovibrio sp. KM01]|uniref:SPOR domain-containing protein n=1 Tax=Bdellovibrio sp. KM01 TaxID=2748865 RepID=UPI002105FA97|nr:SPOR domain-containing protein [Bdellovibrio sp. KM01]